MNQTTLNPLKGALFMVLAGVAFAAANAITWTVTYKMGLKPQSDAFWQYAIASVFSLPFLWRHGFGAMKTAHPILHGVRILDAGCGTGTLAIDLAKRGAEVVAIDLSSTLVEHARERAEEEGVSIDFHSGDMLDPALGTFDYVVAMDSLIHYDLPEMIASLEALAPRVRERMLITVVPGTAMLVAMRAIGRLFPKADRAPAIVPISERAFRTGLLGSRVLESWGMVGTRLVERGFYRSMAIALHHGSMGGAAGAAASRRS